MIIRYTNSLKFYNFKDCCKTYTHTQAARKTHVFIKCRQILNNHRGILRGYCYILNCVTCPKFNPVLWNVTVFGHRIFQEVIKIR